MKRGNRKGSSKNASSPLIPPETETPAGGLTPPAPTADFVTAADGSDAPAPRADLVAAANGPDTPAPAAGSAPRTDSAAAPAAADRRSHPRYEFVAGVEVVAVESSTRMETRVRDLSEQGCYVDTNSPLPLGTVAAVRMRKGTQSFEARARVVYSRFGKGMGLVFTAVEPEQLGTLETWLAESRETSWLAANRRRSQRVLMSIPVRISGKTASGSTFEEETHTLAISAHGALILASTQLYRGQRLTLSNVQTKSALECVVARIEKRRGEHPQVGVEFTLANPIFWHVAFPPKDWTPRHPDAKSQPKTD